MSYRSLLFVPGNRPERYGKALAAGPDVICIDLEDAVGPDDKGAARAAVDAYLAGLDVAGRVGVRINGLESSHCKADCAAIAQRAAVVAFLMVPKLERAEQVAQIRALVGPSCPPVWPVIETTEGLKNAWDIAAAPGVGGVLFGGADYSAELGSDLGWDALLFARGQIVAACARAGVEVLDVPFLDVKDPEGLTASTDRVRLMGFTGRSCIHPDQVAPVNAVFTPTEAAVARARRILEAFEAARGGAALLDGKLIDLPVIRAAKRTLERAGGA